MDSRNLEEVIQKRERGYIFLEKELKRDLAESAAVILVLFLLIILFWGNQNLNMWHMVIVFIVLLAGSLCMSYLHYRRAYKGYESIYHYLEQFEMGNYDYQMAEGVMKEGLQPQILERMEHLGHSFGILSGRMTEEKERTKALITNISHQFKTPLAALRMSFELAEDPSVSEEEQKEFLSLGRTEMGKLEYLLGSLTNVSRMEADMIQMKPLLRGIKKTVVKAVNSIYMKAYEKQIEIEMQDFEDVEIPHDVKWTAEALVNILDNAVKYSMPDTTVKILVEPQVSYILIAVQDEGCGISKEEYPYIFKRFYRGAGKLVDGMEGSGVGLYLVRRILEEQGGSVRVRPSRAGGSIFELMLPKRGYEL